MVSYALLSDLHCADHHGCCMGEFINDSVISSFDVVLALLHLHYLCCVSVAQRRTRYTVLHTAVPCPGLVLYQLYTIRQVRPQSILSPLLYTVRSGRVTINTHLFSIYPELSAASLPASYKADHYKL